MTSRWQTRRSLLKYFPRVVVDSTNTSRQAEASKHLLSKAALLPMLGAFRFMVEISPKTKQAQWRGGFQNVLSLWRSIGSEMMRMTRQTPDDNKRRLHAIGRNRNHWSSLYSAVTAAQLMREAGARELPTRRTATKKQS